MAWILSDLAVVKSAYRNLSITRKISKIWNISARVTKYQYLHTQVSFVEFNLEITDTVPEACIHDIFILYALHLAFLLET